MTFKSAHRLLKERQKLLNAFESGTFSIKKKTQGKEHPLEFGCAASITKMADCKQFKILTPKEMFQR